MRCPICNGQGEIANPKRGNGTVPSEAEAKGIMAQALREKGYSIREIMRLVGWRSPRSVQQALEKNYD